MVSRRLSIISSLIGYQSGDCGYCKAEDSSQRTSNSRAFPCLPMLRSFIGSESLSVLHPLRLRPRMTSHCTAAQVIEKFDELCGSTSLTIPRCFLLCPSKSTKSTALPGAYRPGLETIWNDPLPARRFSILLSTLHDQVLRIPQLIRQLWLLTDQATHIRFQTDS